jgi:tRNA A22 N-methylase
MMDDKRRARIIQEIENLIDFDDAPAHALTRKELMEITGLGKTKLESILKEMGNKVQSCRSIRLNKNGHKYPVRVYWFEDEENTLHR